MATIEVIYYSLDFPGAMFLYDALYNDRRLGAYDLTPILFTSTDGNNSTGCITIMIKKCF